MALATGCNGSSTGGSHTACTSMRNQIQRDEAARNNAQTVGDTTTVLHYRAEVEADARAARDETAMGGPCDISDLVGPNVGR